MDIRLCRRRGKNSMLQPKRRAFTFCHGDRAQLAVRLRAAVVRRLSSDIMQVQSIRGGIAPSPYAGVGLNVIRAIATATPDSVFRSNAMARQPRDIHSRNPCDLLSQCPGMSRWIANVFRWSTYLTCVHWPTYGHRQQTSGWAPDSGPCLVALGAHRLCVAGAHPTLAQSAVDGARDAFCNKSCALGRASWRHVRCSSGPRP